jgi:hypothetical protein
LVELVHLLSAAEETAKGTTAFFVSTLAVSVHSSPSTEVEARAAQPRRRSATERQEEHIEVRNDFPEIWTVASTCRGRLELALQIEEFQCIFV